MLNNDLLIVVPLCDHLTNPAAFVRLPRCTRMMDLFIPAYIRTVLRALAEGRIRWAFWPPGTPPETVVDSSFFDPDPQARPHQQHPTATSSSPMPGRNIVPSPVISARRLHRVEEGPWTISVAETPHDPTSYSLYIKTPTHNLTLTRSAQEIVDLHAKLRDNHPGLKMPTPPIDASSLPAPPKRKSAFLNTLSRFASPSSNKISASRNASGRQQQHQQASNGVSSSAASSNASSSVQTPIATPANEIGDPFAEIGENGEDITALEASNNKVITGLAAYLTAIANDSTLRQARAWKRFVRVRTDDSQSPV
ncbi:hypothetical protein NUW54_g13859 [Trametes sanguinea]|uniref:Uncharacterized protein n=1 Tax=Trametes sanguinea TaxID=158606 RepID=A0ACC1MHJ4_9APHY|nr:hypothetical protein NUW54_g13859 [Trametes sanguinea]